MKKLILYIFLFSIIEVAAQSRGPEKIYEKVNDAVVRIYTYHDDNSMHGQGSGVILKDKGWIISNYHLLGDASYIYAEHNGVYIKLDSILATDEKKDILILKLASDKDSKQFKTIPRLRVGNSDNLKVGQRIYAIGSPYGFENTMTEGIISGLRSSFDSSRSFIQISAPISSGSSGGAVLNAKGELIGISTMVIAGETAQNLNFALPINDVILLSELSIQKSNDPELISVVEYYRKGQNDYMAQKYYSALDNFRSALQICNDKEQRGALYYYMGLSYQRLINYDSAEFYFDKSLHQVISADTYMRLGEIKTDKKDYKLAGLYFEKAISESPNAWEAYNNLGVIYYKQKEYIKAIEQLKFSLKLYPKNPNACYLLGKIAEDTGKDDIAISFYTDAIRLNPQYAEAYLALSGIYLDAGETEKAIRYQQKAYQINPKLRNNKR